jgi:hypothetical protein
MHLFREVNGNVFFFFDPTVARTKIRDSRIVVQKTALAFVGVGARSE